MTLNLTAPESWSELTQEQLSYMLKAMSIVNRMTLNRSFRSKEDCGWQVSANVATRCLLHWNRLKVVTPYAGGWILARDGKEYLVSAGDLATAASMMSWMSRIPEAPVRLDVIDGARAISADVEEDLTFDDYLAIEALWQVWQQTNDDRLLRSMAAILYRKEDIRLENFELLSIFYWWASLKAMLSVRYPNFLQTSPVDPAEPHVDELTLRRSMDSQIRALTKGDITKEKMILSLPAIRALTELDALAREYEELNRKYPSK